MIVRRSRRSAVGYDWSDVAAFETTEVLLRRGAAPQPDEGAPDALRLARDVLDTQIVDVAGARVVRVADVELERCAGELRVAGVDVGAGRSCGVSGCGASAPGAARRRSRGTRFNPASARGHLLALDTPGAAVHRLRGAELAQVAASLAPARAAEVLRAVGPERAAGAVAAAHSRAAGRLLAELDVEDAAPIVSAMASDDAAAALRTIESPGRADLLAELDARRRDELARLLAHRPGSAAGLMSTDVRTAPAGASRDEVRARLAARPPRLEGLATVLGPHALGRTGRLAHGGRDRAPRRLRRGAAAAESLTRAVRDRGSRAVLSRSTVAHDTGTRPASASALPMSTRTGTTSDAGRTSGARGAPRTVRYDERKRPAILLGGHHSE